MADVRLSTPFGTAVYPRLKTPDTKFNELGIYKADVSVPLAEAEDLMAKLQGFHKAHTGKAAPKASNTMWEMELDSEGVETGNVIFKCRVKNVLRKNGEIWNRRPKQFDARMKPIDVNPWGGSTYAVSFDVYEWVAGAKKGISLQPVGVQITDLKTGSGPDASSMGFKPQEGYVGEDYDEDEDDTAGVTDQSGETDEADDSDVSNGDY